MTNNETSTETSRNTTRDAAEKSIFSYEEAFSRNIGLLTNTEQTLLSTRCVAIPGLGGVGGIHALSMARLGVGRFHIADPDRFELANFNRQFGATLKSIDRRKTTTIADDIHRINPDAIVRRFDTGISLDNLDEFLAGVDLVVDGLDFYAVDVRRQLFKAAASTGLHVITAGPVGFSCAMIVFSPDGMSVDDYFGFSDAQSKIQMRNRFAIGLTPSHTHLPYMSLSKTDLRKGNGPSLALATNLCAAMAATEAIRILLNRGGVLSAPHYVQFDTYRRIYKRGYLFLGHRNPLQRLKTWYLDRRFH